MIFWKIRGRWHLDKLGAGNWELTPRQARWEEWRVGNGHLGFARCTENTRQHASTYFDLLRLRSVLDARCKMLGWRSGELRVFCGLINDIVKPRLLKMK